jgi:signal transduction histidine kinase
VIIHAYAEAEQAHVMFENFGVPIQADEIQNGLIFQFGYRGSLSGDRGRLGTGIGLTDALNTARLHGGDIKVESTSARHGAPPDDYTAPYITKVTLSLPIHPHTGAQHEKKVFHPMD